MPPLVDRNSRQRRALRAGRDHDGAGLDLLHRALGAAHGNPAGCGNATATLQPVDLVFAEQKFNAARQSGHDPVLASHHLPEIERHLAEVDAVLGEGLPGLGKFLRGLQQSLRGNAADVEAGAAETAARIDACSAQSELRRANRGNISSGTAADHDDIIALGHHSGFSARLRPQELRQRWSRDKASNAGRISPVAGRARRQRRREVVSGSVAAVTTTRQPSCRQMRSSLGAKGRSLLFSQKPQR